MISETPPNHDDPLKALAASERLRVDELIDEFELARDAGRPVTVETLCAAEPELLSAVTDSLARLAAVDQRRHLLDTANRPKQIGEFLVLEQIGVGGSGVVFRCQQKNPNRVVAVKVLKPTLDPEDQEKRFRREMRVFESVKTTGLAEVFVSGITQWNGVRCFWFAMQLLSGGRIDSYVFEHKCTQKTILRKFRSICVTLQAAHRQGIVHRDVKPSNILVSDDGEPHLVDFGVATIATFDDREATRSIEAMAGTLAWMAPEVVLGTLVTPDTRSDIYSLGVVLFQLLADKHPSGSTKLSFAEVTVRFQSDKAIRLSHATDNVSRDLDTFLCRLLDYDPDYRYQNMDDVIADTDRLLADEPVKARSVSAYERTWRWCRKNVLLSTITGAAFVAIVSALAIFFVSANRVQHFADQLRRTNAELEHSLDLRERAIVSARLAKMSDHLEADPQAASRQLNDATRFPPSLRGFSWDLLNFQANTEYFQIPCDDEAIRAVHFSHDDSLIATVSDGGDLQVHDVASGKRLWRAPGVQRNTELRFSGDDAFLYCVSAEAGILQYDVATGQQQKVWLPETPCRRLIDYSEDAQSIVAQTRDNVLIRVAVASDEINTRAMDDNSRLAGLWFQDKGRVVGGITHTGQLKTWRSPTLTPDSERDLTSIDSRLGSFRRAITNADMDDGPVYAVLNGRKEVVAIRPDATPKPTVQKFSVRNEQIMAIALRPPFDVLMTVPFQTRLISTQGRSRTRTFGDGVRRSLCCAVSSNGKRIAIGDEDGTVRVYGLETPSIEHELQISAKSWPEHNFNSPLITAGSDSGPFTFVGYLDDTLVTFDNETLASVSVAKIANGPVRGLAVPQSEEWVACGVASGATGVYVCQTSQLLPSTTDGRAAPADSVLGPTFQIPLPSVRTLRLGHADRTLFAAHRNGAISAIDTETWKVRHTWHGHDDGAYSLDTFENLLVSGGSDGWIRVWNSQTYELIAAWEAHNKRITGLQLSPDGDRVYSSSLDHTVAIWSIHGECVRRMKGHTSTVRDIAVSPDGKTLATASEDSTICLWDAEAGEAQLILDSHANLVQSVRFCPLGLLSTSQDGTTRLWGAHCDASKHPKPN